jgi:hypothetical protein
MRTAFIVVAFSSIIGCLADPEPEPTLAATAPASIGTATDARSRLEQGFDTLLRANGGSACDVERGVQACVATTAAGGLRTLRVGDPIPSVSTLRLCSTGGSCTLLPPPPPPTTFHCHALIPCVPLLVGCIVHGELICHSSESQRQGAAADLSCSCQDTTS